MYSVHVREHERNMQALFLMSGKYTVCGITKLTKFDYQLFPTVAIHF